VTGFDIIFFWVARMIMFGLKFTDKVPFKDIYITGLVRDASGAKMSKSKGNVLDPLDLIDGISLADLIAKRTQGLMQPEMAKKIEKQTKKDFPDGIASFGTDALRFTFAALASFGRDIKFDLKRIEGYRNFCNKLWNASRYISLKVDFENIDTQNIDLNKLSMIDNWILSRLQETKIQVNKHIGDYRLDLMAQTLYEFVWGDYCDWYLELSKTIDNEADKKANEIVLIKVLQEILKLLHPIIPFITEEISQSLFDEKLVHASYPKVEENLINNNAQEEILWLQNFVLGIRQIRGEMNISPKKELDCFVDNASDKDELLLEKYKKTLCQIVNLNDINKKSEEKEYGTTLVGRMNVLVPLAGLVDIEQEFKRLSKEIEKLEKFKKQLSGKLNNDKFMNSAPAEIIEKEQQKFEQTQESIAELTQQLDTIKNT
jgi:valyl-tRNA synthetase